MTLFVRHATTVASAPASSFSCSNVSLSEGSSERETIARTMSAANTAGGTNRNTPSTYAGTSSSRPKRKMNESRSTYVPMPTIKNTSQIVGWPYSVIMSTRPVCRPRLGPPPARSSYCESCNLGTNRLCVPVDDPSCSGHTRLSIRLIPCARVSRSNYSSSSDTMVTTDDPTKRKRKCLPNAEICYHSVRFSSC